MRLFWWFEKRGGAECFHEFATDEEAIRADRAAHERQRRLPSLERFRARVMARLYDEELFTLEEIAQLWDITRERVRQLILTARTADEGRARRRRHASVAVTPAFSVDALPMLTGVAEAKTRLKRQYPPPARRMIRESAGLSQADIAEIVHACRVTVSRWEGGVRSPRGSYAVRYVELLAALQKAMEEQ